jgi:hypothetical protein
MKLSFIEVVRVWKLVADFEGGTQAAGIWERGAEKNIWA